MKKSRRTTLTRDLVPEVPAGAIKDALDSNVLARKVEKAALFRRGIEGVDVGLDGCDQRGEGRLVLGRIPKQMFPLKRTERRVRLHGGGGGGRHVDVSRLSLIFLALACRPKYFFAASNFSSREALT